MLRTVLMAFFSLAVGYIILVVLIDGVLQDSFPAMIISLLMKFGMSQTEADRVYGTVFTTVSSSPNLPDTVFHSPNTISG